MSDEGARDVRSPLKRSLSGAVSAVAIFCSPSAFASSCEDLTGIKLADTRIESAQSVPAGDYTSSDKIARKGMPAFCRVLASVKRAPGSDIRIEMWLPKAGWTGVFHGSGYGGSLAYNYGAMEEGLKRGYATAITDMGTAPATPLDGDTLEGHPQKWKDWGILSTHVMAVAGKDISPLKNSPGCSWFRALDTASGERAQTGSTQRRSAAWAPRPPTPTMTRSPR